MDTTGIGGGGQEDQLARHTAELAATFARHMATLAATKGYVQLLISDVDNKLGTPHRQLQFRAAWADLSDGERQDYAAKVESVRKAATKHRAAAAASVAREAAASVAREAAGGGAGRASPQQSAARAAAGPAAAAAAVAAAVAAPGAAPSWPRYVQGKGVVARRSITRVQKKIEDKERLKTTLRAAAYIAEYTYVDAHTGMFHCGALRRIDEANYPPWADYMVDNPNPLQRQNLLSMRDRMSKFIRLIDEAQTILVNAYPELDPQAGPTTSQLQAGPTTSQFLF